MLRSYFVCLLLLFGGLSVYGQLNEDILSISEEVNTGRYTTIEGSPYYYENWQSGDVISSDGNRHTLRMINYNGLTGDLEVSDGTTIRKLLLGGYLKVIVKINDRTDTYLRGIHSDFNLELICVSYDGSRLKLLTDFNVTKEKFQDGRSNVEKFIRRSSSYIMLDGKLDAVSYRKKKIISILGHGDELEKYLKENKISIRSIDDLVMLLTYYENSIM